VEREKEKKKKKGKEEEQEERSILIGAIEALSRSSSQRYSGGPFGEKTHTRVEAQAVPHLDAMKELPCRRAFVRRESIFRSRAQREASTTARVNGI